MRCRRPKERPGSVLALVLVMTVLMSFIVLAFIEETVRMMRYQGVVHQQDDLRLAAYAGLDATLAVLAEYDEVEEGLWGPTQGWGHALEQARERGLDLPADIALEVSFVDEGGKIPFSRIGQNYQELMILFEFLGFPQNDTAEMADALIDWQDSDDFKRLSGFDGDDYRDLEPPITPANAPLRTWAEFRLIPPLAERFWDEAGQPTGAWTSLRQLITLENTQHVNLNTATDATLAYLNERGAIDAAYVREWLAGRDGVRGTDDDRLIKELGSYQLNETALNLGSTVQWLKVEVIATRADAQFVVSAALSWVPKRADEDDRDPGNDNGDGPNPDNEPPDNGNDPPENNDPPPDDASTDDPDPTIQTLPGILPSIRPEDTATIAQELRYPFIIERIVENHKL